MKEKRLKNRGRRCWKESPFFLICVHLRPSAVGFLTFIAADIQIALALIPQLLAIDRRPSTA